MTPCPISCLSGDLGAVSFFRGASFEGLNNPNQESSDTHTTRLQLRKDRGCLTLRADANRCSPATS